jgi:uncharacterized protein YndB with AHSA1/START domain
MTVREQYATGPARGAQLEKDGQNWTLVLVRELHQPPEKVWQMLTNPAQLREWAPFDADANLGTLGNTVTLSTVGAPTTHVTETTVTHADSPKTLEYNWGGFDMRWELEAIEDHTRLTLTTKIDRRYAAMAAAGWHVCLDALDRYLGGQPIGRIAGTGAMKVDGWRQLNAEYAQQFGVASPGGPPTRHSADAP